MSGVRVWVVVDKHELSAPLKWAGGKRTLLPRLRDLYSPYRDRRLVEPFVGGMNVALGLRPEHALLADANVHLINLYHRLRDPQPFTLEMRNSEHLYYAYRKAFNEIITARSDGGVGGLATSTIADSSTSRSVSTRRSIIDAILQSTRHTCGAGRFGGRRSISRSRRRTRATSFTQIPRMTAPLSTTARADSPGSNR